MAGDGRLLQPRKVTSSPTASAPDIRTKHALLSIRPISENHRSALLRGIISLITAISFYFIKQVKNEKKCSTEHPPNSSSLNPLLPLISLPSTLHHEENIKPPNPPFYPLKPFFLDKKIPLVVKSSRFLPRPRRFFVYPFSRPSPPQKNLPMYKENK